jgi:hypothetical protein
LNKDLEFYIFGISAYVWDFGINFGFGISALVSADIWRKPKYFGTKQMSFAPKSIDRPIGLSTICVSMGVNARVPVCLDKQILKHQSNPPFPRSY